MPVDRRSFITKSSAAASMLSLGVGIPKFAHAAEFTYRLSHSVPVNHPLHIRAEEAAKKIKEETNGRFELLVFPSDQLGAQTDVMSQTRSGAIDFFCLSGVVLSTLVPSSAISGLGFAFKDYDAVWKAMDGGLGEFIRSEIAKSRSLFAFEKIWDNGYRQITSAARPVVSPNDIAGMKVRVPPSPMWISLFKALGGSPTTITANELYSSLQTRIVDAQENPLAVISTLKLYEVQKYCTMTNHMWDGFWLLANKRNFDALPEDIQATVQKHLNAGAMAERSDLVELNTSLRQQLTDKGMTFAEANVAEYQAKLRDAGFYDEWRKKFPAAGWEQLESITGKL
nr:TRAP transporter substrate-binding protein [Lampropedia puyangensis]